MHHPDVIFCRLCHHEPPYKNSGAFYTYISTGLGKNWGAPASVLALIAYISVQIAVVAMLGYFTQLFLEQHLNTDIPWWLLSMIFIIIVWMLSIKRVEIGGKILGVLMLAEAGIVLLTDICLLVKKTTPSVTSLLNLPYFYTVIWGSLLFSLSPVLLDSSRQQFMPKNAGIRKKPCHGQLSVPCY